MEEMKQATALDEWMVNNKACAKPGFKRDLQYVSTIVERAYTAGLSDTMCDEVTEWLLEVIPFYLHKRKVDLKGGYKVQVSLKKSELVTALKRKINSVSMGVITL
jgi:hypothetical protein